MTTEDNGNPIVEDQYQTGTGGPSGTIPYPQYGVPEEELRAQYARNNPPGPEPYVTPPSQATMEALMMRLNQLEIMNNELMANRQSTRPQHPPRIKSRRPEPFRGEASRLEAFLTATNTFFHMESLNFPTDRDKIMDTTLNFQGAPSQWIQPYMDKYMDDNYSRGSETEAIFATWDTFREALRKMYGNADIQAAAVRLIESLKMRGNNIQEYTSRFQQERAKALIEDPIALKRYYYNGLTEYVKDELSRGGKAFDLADLIDRATEINARTYERQMEKRGYNTHHSSNQSHPRQPRTDSQGDTIMRNAMISTSKKPAWKGKKTFGNKKSNNKKWAHKNKLRDEGKCFRCEKPGHMADTCPDKPTSNPVKLAMITSLEDDRALTWEEIEPRTKEGACWVCGEKNHIQYTCKTPYWKAYVNGDKRTIDAIRQAALRQNGIKDTKEALGNFIDNLIEDENKWPAEEEGPLGEPFEAIDYTREVIEDFAQLVLDEWTDVGQDSDNSAKQSEKGPCEVATDSWYHCTDSDCLDHLREKHLTGWYPAQMASRSGKDKLRFIATIKHCESDTCPCNGTETDHESLSWYQCSQLTNHYTSCPYHWFQMKAKARAEEAFEHSLLSKKDCRVKDCSTGHLGVTHDTIHWTLCKDDDCAKHLKEKEDMFFPGKYHDALPSRECPYPEICPYHEVTPNPASDDWPRFVRENREITLDEATKNLARHETEPWWECYEPDCPPHFNQKRDNYIPTKEHDSLHFTFCYRTGCMSHYAAKQGSSHYPKAPRKPKDGKHRHRTGKGEATPKDESGHDWQK